MIARRFVIAVTSSVALALVPVAASPASASSPCTAKMSITNPKQYSSTTITVSRVHARASVKTTASYKTTKTSHTATASLQGVATIVYKISGATKGRKVPVSVTAKYGSTTYTCSTSFTPR